MLTFDLRPVCSKEKSSEEIFAKTWHNSSIALLVMHTNAKRAHSVISSMYQLGVREVLHRHTALFSYGMRLKTGRRHVSAWLTAPRLDVLALNESRGTASGLYQGLAWLCKE